MDLLLILFVVIGFWVVFLLCFLGGGIRIITRATTSFGCCLCKMLVCIFISVF